MHRSIIIIAVVLLLVIIGVIGFFIKQASNDSADIRTITVESQTVTQNVTFTGRLESAVSSDLAFELPGTVTAVFIKEGAVVSAGQSLARLDTSSANLELALAHATSANTQDAKKLALEYAEKNLQQTTAANAPTIAKRQQAVRDAKREVDQAKLVHQQRAAESGDSSAATEATIATLRAAETTYHAAQKTLTETLAAVAKDNTAADAAASAARAEYVATIQAARGIAGLSNVEASEALAAQKITKHTLIAPFAGTVTVIHHQIGEAVLAGAAIMTIATTDQIELVASATETDAVKLAVGMPATITFDALSETQEWSATITYLSPAARIIEGMATYICKMVLTGDVNNLKPGLTATITVHAAAKNNVFAIPRRAIKTYDRQEFVSVIAKDGTISEKKITTGLVGSAGAVEVTSGLSLGDQVVINPGELPDEP